MRNQPLTDKAKKAIALYVNLCMVEDRTVDRVISLTLKAERMRRDDLYQWLDKHGYSWRSKWSRWLPKGQRA